MSNFGQQLRFIRQQKGFGLNEFAKELGVSPAYLSNLETGKTDTIQLKVLSKLLGEFQMVVDEKKSLNDPVVWRTERIRELILDLHRRNPPAADFFLTMIENGMELFSSRSTDIH